VTQAAPELWRIALPADGRSQAAFAAALEEVAESISAFESAPGGAWRIEALTTTEPDVSAIRVRLAAVAEAVGTRPPEIEIGPMPKVDWLAENRRAFPPLAVGRYFVFGTHFAGAPPAGARLIKLDASIAFGSGEHATTRGCLLALDRLARAGRARRVLDVGCGSGILAIGAARSWPARVIASDIDRDSVRLAAENMQRNGVAARVAVLCSDGLARVRPRRGYDVVLANILARPLCRLSGAIARAVRPGGTVILSGLLAGQESEVRCAYRARRLRLSRRIPIGGWHTLVFRRGRQ
jgi:ribosomal protein L11 methyltransferase